MLYNGANNRRLLHGNLHCIYPVLHGTSLTLTSPYPHVVKAPLELPTPGLPIIHSPHPIVFCRSNTSASIQVHTWTPIALEVPTLLTRTVLTPWFSYTSNISALLSAHRQLTPIVPLNGRRPVLQVPRTCIPLQCSFILPTFPTSSCQCCS